MVFNQKPPLDDLDVHQLDFNYLTIKSKIELDEQHKTTKATVQLRLKKDSVIWFNLSGTLGVQGMRGLVTKDSVYIINRVNKEYSIYSFDDVSKEFNFPIDFELIQSMIVGNMPKGNQKGQMVKKQANQYIIRQNFGDILIDNYVNSSVMKLTEVQVTEKATENSLKLLYKNFGDLNGQAFPYSAFVSLTHYNEFGELHTELVIDHQKVETEDKPLKFPFNIPKKYVRK